MGGSKDKKKKSSGHRSGKDKKKKRDEKLRKAFEGPTKIALNEIQLGEKLVCFFLTSVAYLKFLRSLGWWCVWVRL